jgi:hypothetical protein
MEAEGQHPNEGNPLYPGAPFGRSSDSERVEEIAHGAPGVDGTLVHSFADSLDRRVSPMPKSDLILAHLAVSIYFGIVSGLLAWGMDAGIMWEAIVGLAGATPA